MKQDNEGLWKFHLMAEYPTELIVNIWGMNPDGAPDKSAAYGDVDGDNVLDWVSPDSLSRNVVNVTDPPPHPYLGFRVVVNDGNYNYSLEPAGSVWIQLVLGICLGIAPLLSAIAGVMIYRRSFYQVKFNKIGLPVETSYARTSALTEKAKSILSWIKPKDTDEEVPRSPDTAISGALAAAAGSPTRRSVLIATMEYEIEDWNLKVKIGGLGVMASLMGKNLAHQDLIWVVPCVGDIDYPVDQPGEVMTVTILGQNYEIEVQYHQVRNITYILLDAPVFRKQTKKEPYPARMDDLESAIFYSAWNSCIAQAIDRFHIDLYHVK
jgi:alpha-1,3-glucan synthase